MLGRLMDFVMGLVSKIFFGVQHSSTAPLFDLDVFFDRISHLAENLVDRFQKTLIAMMALASLILLAVSVLTVRIFQLSSERTVRILGLFDMDGALFFGAVLALAAAALGPWILKSSRAPRQARRTEPQPHHEIPRAPPPSPLEEALAAWIHSRIREGARHAEAENSPPAWNSSPPRASSSGLPDDALHPSQSN